MTDLIAEIKSAKARGENLEAALDLVIRHADAQGGTVHRFDRAAGILRLAAQRHIPPPVLGLIGEIPLGKGLAGLAAERREPVRICNLQTDASGSVRPGAKATGMEGAIAVPMIVEGELFGVLGVAKAGAYDWSDAEAQGLVAAGTGMAEEWLR